MTYEKTKLLLEQLKRAKYYAEKQQEELAELITSYQMLTYHPDTVSIKTYKVKDPVAKTVEKIEEAQKAYAAAWAEVFAEIDRVKDLMQQLPTDERNILEDYYLRGKSSRYLATKLSYERRTITRKIGKGIEQLSKIM